MKPQNGIFLILVLAIVSFMAACQADRHTVRYPFGPADFDDVEASDTLSILVRNGLTYVSVDTLSSAAVVNITTSKGLPAGSMVYLSVKSDDTARTVTPSSGFTSAAISGAIGKTKVAGFIWDGSSFVHVSTQQVN